MLSRIFKWLKLVCLTLFISISFLVLKLLYFIPFTNDFVTKKFMALSHLSKEDFDGCIFTWVMFKEVLKQTKLDIFKIAQLGKRAPEIRMCKVERDHIAETEDEKVSDAENKVVKMSEIWKPGIPLVVNFGSCS